MNRLNRVLSAPTATPRPALEFLEGRTLFAAAPLAVTVTEVNAVVDVTGTRRGDDIHLALNVTDSNLVDVISAGVVVHTFDKTLVAAVNIRAGNGPDRVTCDVGLGLGLGVLVKLAGGNGNDTITGGDDAEDLYGGNGRDFLLGGAGDDMLMGSNGRDQLDGGLDDDFLCGGKGLDLLLGGLGTDVFITIDKLGELADYLDGDDDYASPFEVVDLFGDFLEGLIEIPWLLLK